MSFIPRRIFPEYLLTLSNFKGHHQKALTRLGHLAPQIDLVIEVRDSRAPLSTTNVLFDKVLARKERVVLYSKKDLSIIKNSMLKKWHESQNQQYMFVDSRSANDAQRVIDLVKKRYENLPLPPPLGLRLMIIGMPNVGKSTLVNTLRDVGYSSKQNTISSKKKKVAKTGGQPGVTRNTSEIIRLSENPDILVYDTPGVFLPTVKDSETMLALSLVGCVHTSFVDPVIQADYLLYLLNLQDPSGSKYSEYMSHPTNDIHELLYNIAKTRNTLKNDKYDELGVATHWTNLWKQGKSKKYKGLFDLGAILDLNGEELKKMFKEERERVNNTSVGTRLNDRLGDDNDTNRKRTAKDREYDLRNQLFKL